MSNSLISTVTTRHRHYVLFMVTLVFVVNYLDRQILAILLPLIKAEFKLSDSALGLLAGPAFAVIYATLGIPLALVADRMNRRNIIAGSLALFSLMTVFCNYASSFTQLLFARFGTGIGEAGTGPSINSMIADLYPPKERATALSIYSAGSERRLADCLLRRRLDRATLWLARGIPRIRPAWSGSRLSLSRHGRRTEARP